MAAVWPGRCCFPDFLREDVRRWFGGLYRPLLEAGIEGFWNDMNEPALFYSDEGVADAFAKVEAIRGGNVDFETTWWLKDAFNSIANNPEDYRRFYHLVDGKPVRHDLVHNLYGAGMTRATAEAFRLWISFPPTWARPGTAGFSRRCWRCRKTGRSCSIAPRGRTARAAEPC